MDDMSTDEKVMDIAEMDDEALAAERFIMKGEDVEVLSVPQCVDCVHNLGLECAAYGKKKEEYLHNEKKCPKLKIEKEELV